MKRIIVDMDDVLAETSEALINCYNKEFEKKRETLTLENFGELFQMHSVTTEEIRNYLFQEGFFRKLNVKQDSQEVMKELYEKYEVFIVSAATEFPFSLQEKLEWLNEHFSFVNWRRIVFCGDKSITKGDIMIDDLPRNLEAFDGEKILFSAPHNLKNILYKRVLSWKEIASLFL